jgi:hypothetical protein
VVGVLRLYEVIGFLTEYVAFMLGAVVMVELLLPARLEVLPGIDVPAGLEVLARLVLSRLLKRSLMAPGCRRQRNMHIPARSW